MFHINSSTISIGWVLKSRSGGSCRIYGDNSGFQRCSPTSEGTGFDGVEIHSAHGYLLNQFFSPLTNKRSDGYGGDVKNRIKIHLEVIKAVRQAVGEDFPVFLRLGACDYMEGGTTAEDSKIAVKEIKKAVSIPVILTGGITEVQAAEKLLEEGKADLIGVGRAIYKDSQWTQKAIESLR